jgi:hypothetical protein
LASWKGLDAMLLRLLAKNRDDRPGDVAELLGMMDAVRPTAPARQQTVQEIRRPTMIEPEPARPTPVPIPAPAPDRQTEQIGQTEQIEQTRHVGQVTRLSPNLDAEPNADAVKPRRGSKWIPEVIIAVVVAAVFFFSWQESRTRDANLSAATPTQTTSGAESQPAVGRDAHDPQCSLDAICQQAETLSDQGHFKKAIPLFDQACKAGVPQACSDLGHLYDWGPHFSEADSVTQSFPRALNLYKKACDAGNAYGCAGLGAMYDMGRGVRQDLSRAAALYTKGCDGGNGTACNNLGVALMHGAGVPEDKDKAREVLKWGCALGNDAACDWLKQL